jgi:hypothetical protein
MRPSSGTFAEHADICPITRVSASETIERVVEIDETDFSQEGRRIHRFDDDEEKTKNTVFL